MVKRKKRKNTDKTMPLHPNISKKIKGGSGKQIRRCRQDYGRLRHLKDKALIN